MCAPRSAAGLLHGGVGGGLVYDSLGTAEALVGAFPQRALNEQDHRSGFSFGLHVAPGFCYWMGGINAAGGSLEWLRGILGDPKLSYPQLERLLDGAPDAPGDLLYLPFLNGRGAPNRDPQARAAFVGLSASHGRAHLARAVLEGTALELACILEQARRDLGVTTEVLAAAGGGVYNRRWMQIRADVTGCRIHVLPQAEAARCWARRRWLAWVVGFLKVWSKRVGYLHLLQARRQSPMLPPTQQARHTCRMQISTLLTSFKCTNTGGLWMQCLQFHETYLPGFYVIHGAGYFDFTGGFHCLQDGAFLPDSCHIDLNVPLRHQMHKLGVRA